MRILLSVIVAFLVFVGVGASVFHYMKEPYNPGFLEYPNITAVHVILGAIYLSFAPFQFVARIRSRWLNYHRYVGRILVSIGLLVGVSAFFIALVFPFSGWPESIVNGIFSVLFTLFLCRGFMSIRAGDMLSHREWMIRAFAIGLAIATMRLIFVPSITIMGASAVEDIQMLSTIAFAIAFISHSLFAEFWIRKTRV